MQQSALHLRLQGVFFFDGDFGPEEWHRNGVDFSMFKLYDGLKRSILYNYEYDICIFC